MPDRLSIVDASLLSTDTSATPLLMGGVGLFAGGLEYGTVAQALERRLDRVPLARRRVQLPPPGAGRPVWVDDVDFDLSYHLRHAALPSPGDAGQLGEFLSRLVARPLDRSRPLWELYVIEGLEGGRVAVFRKVHLAMAGEGFNDPFGVMLDDTPDPTDADVIPLRWEPRSQPGQLNLAVHAARERLAVLTRLGRGMRTTAERVVTDPGVLVDAATAAATSAVSVVVRLAQQAPSSPLNVPLTPHRRFTMVRLDLEDLREIRRAVGSTINDIVVAVTADAVGRLLRWRGYDTKDLDLRVMVPLRVHEGGAAPEELNLLGVRTAGSGVVGVLAPLPVMQMDPAARLYRIMGEMSQAREARQAIAAKTLVRLAGYAPPNLHAMAARVAWAEQRYNVALSNAPGPQSPRYLAGCRLEESYPFIPLSGNAALSVAVSSYAGSMFVGLLGDRDAMADLDLLGEFFGEAVADLVVATQATGD
ncbi:MAG: wax ester/triacylglycerol synthase family O-acyltransferase [Nitriliruptorales bacterium]|nr:wax ester/triacylglycerol synthase family O-acyltransferase [Nitriliruptorales bacterium]